MTQLAKQAAAVIQKQCDNFKPKLGIVLGSGLGEFVNHISDSIAIPYNELPGFKHSTVAGHAGRLVLGKLNNAPVVCMQGRSHLYEGTQAETIHTAIRTLKLIGCETLIITNASGSLRADVLPGELMLITDHINFQFSNPLVGPNDDEFGSRFVGMEDTYDKHLRELMLTAAKELNIRLTEGVYISTLGPTFETPAEIRAFRVLGADLVGMSTVPEVIVARHCGLKVVAVAAISNLAAGMSAENLSHEVTLKGASMASEKLSRLLLTFIDKIKVERAQHG